MFSNFFLRLEWKYLTKIVPARHFIRLIPGMIVDVGGFVYSKGQFGNYNFSSGWNLIFSPDLVNSTSLWKLLHNGVLCGSLIFPASLYLL